MLSKAKEIVQQLRDCGAEVYGEEKLYEKLLRMEKERELNHRFMYLTDVYRYNRHLRRVRDWGNGAAVFLVHFMHMDDGIIGEDKEGNRCWKKHCYKCKEWAPRIRDVYCTSCGYRHYPTTN